MMHVIRQYSNVRIPKKKDSDIIRLSSQIEQYTKRHANRSHAPRSAQIPKVTRIKQSKRLTIFFFEIFGLARSLFNRTYCQYNMLVCKR